MQVLLGRCPIGYILLCKYSLQESDDKTLMANAKNQMDSSVQIVSKWATTTVGNNNNNLVPHQSPMDLRRGDEQR